MDGRRDTTPAEYAQRESALKTSAETGKTTAQFIPESDVQVHLPQAFLAMPLDPRNPAETYGTTINKTQQIATEMAALREKMYDNNSNPRAYKKLLQQETALRQQLRAAQGILAKARANNLQYQDDIRKAEAFIAQLASGKVLFNDGRNMNIAKETILKEDLLKNKDFPAEERVKYREKLVADAKELRTKYITTMTQLSAAADPEEIQKLRAQADGLARQLTINERKAEAVLGQDKTFRERVRPQFNPLSAGERFFAGFRVQGTLREIDDIERAITQLNQHVQNTVDRLGNLPQHLVTLEGMQQHLFVDRGVGDFNEGLIAEFAYMNSNNADVAEQARDEDLSENIAVALRDQFDLLERFEGTNMMGYMSMGRRDRVIAGPGGTPINYQNVVDNIARNISQIVDVPVTYELLTEERVDGPRFIDEIMRIRASLDRENELEVLLAPGHIPALTPAERDAATNEYEKLEKINEIELRSLRIEMLSAYEWQMAIIQADLVPPENLPRNQRRAAWRLLNDIPAEHRQRIRETKEDLLAVVNKDLVNRFDLLADRFQYTNRLTLGERVQLLMAGASLGKVVRQQSVESIMPDDKDLKLMESMLQEQEGRLYRLGKVRADNPAVLDAFDPDVREFFDMVNRYRIFRDRASANEAALFARQLASAGGFIAFIKSFTPGLTNINPVGSSNAINLEDDRDLEEQINRLEDGLIRVYNEAGRLPPAERANFLNRLNLPDTYELARQQVVQIGITNNLNERRKEVARSQGNNLRELTRRGQTVRPVGETDVERARRQLDMRLENEALYDNIEDGIRELRRVPNLLEEFNNVIASINKLRRHEQYAENIGEEAELFDFALDSDNLEFQVQRILINRVDNMTRNLDSFVVDPADLELSTRRIRNVITYLQNAQSVSDTEAEKREFQRRIDELTARLTPPPAATP